MNIALTPLLPTEVAATHMIYNRAFDWLAAKGVRQWLLRLDEGSFAKRQAAGEAYAIRVDGALAGSVFVPFETIAYYGEALRQAPRWWLHTLVIDRAFAGKGIGEQAVEAICTAVQARGGESLWLHCVNDAGHPEVMPRYYARLGFTEFLRTEVTYPSGNAFPMVVMQRTLG